MAVVRFEEATDGAVVSERREDGHLSWESDLRHARQEDTSTKERRTSRRSSPDTAPGHLRTDDGTLRDRGGGVSLIRSAVRPRRATRHPDRAGVPDLGR